MAKIIDDAALPSGGDRKLYPWAEWFDGRTRELTRGEDFDRDVEAFARQIYPAAKTRGFRARVSVVDEKTIRIRATKPDAP